MDLSLALPKNWLVIGDSVTKGIILTDEGRYETSDRNFMQLVADKLDSQVRNISIFGATVQKGLQRFHRLRKNLPTEGLAFIEFGGNDCDFLWSEVGDNPTLPHEPNLTIQRFRETYQELILEIKDHGLVPILLSLPPLDAERYFQAFTNGFDQIKKAKILEWLGGSVDAIYRWHEAYNDVIPELARETGAAFIDIRQPFLLARKPYQFICEDGIHPNVAGHQLIADTLKESMTHCYDTILRKANKLSQRFLPRSPESKTETDE